MAHNTFRFLGIPIHGTPNNFVWKSLFYYLTRGLTTKRGYKEFLNMKKKIREEINDQVARFQTLFYEGKIGFGKIIDVNKLLYHNTLWDSVYFLRVDNKLTSFRQTNKRTLFPTSLRARKLGLSLSSCREKHVVNILLWFYLHVIP